MINVRFIKYLSTPFYADEGISFLDLRFENDVKMYGTQAQGNAQWNKSEFENDVKMYGTQAKQTYDLMCRLFENDVKMYGTQAISLAPSVALFV